MVKIYVLTIHDFPKKSVVVKYRKKADASRRKNNEKKKGKIARIEVFDI